MLELYTSVLPESKPLASGETSNISKVTGLSISLPIALILCTIGRTLMTSSWSNLSSTITTCKTALYNGILLTYKRGLQTMSSSLFNSNDVQERTSNNAFIIDSIQMMYKRGLETMLSSSTQYININEKNKIQASL